MTSSNGNLFRVTGPSCGEFTGHKGQWRGALMFSLICAWINGWVNNREAGDLLRHRAHDDVNVMFPCTNRHVSCCRIENSRGTTVEVWEWINTFIPLFVERVITYPSPGSSNQSCSSRITELSVDYYHQEYSFSEGFVASEPKINVTFLWTQLMASRKQQSWDTYRIMYRLKWRTAYALTKVILVFISRRAKQQGK